MSFDFIRISGLGLLAIGLVGCGGGSNNGGGDGGGGGGGNPTVVTVKVTGGTPTALAAKIGTGAFAATSLTGGTVSLSLPQGTTSFALVIRCPQQTRTVSEVTFNSNSQILMEATTADGTSFTLPCPLPIDPPTPGTLTGSVDASAIAGVNAVEVVGANDTSLGSSSSRKAPRPLSAIPFLREPTGWRWAGM